MKIKATVSPVFGLEEVFSSEGFDEIWYKFLRELGVDNPEDRPAEFFRQFPDLMGGKIHGVNVQVSQCSRGQRMSSQFQKALTGLVCGCADLIRDCVPAGEKVQLFAAIALDEEVPVPNFKGGATYTRLIESDPVWIDSTAA